ncbi:non-ribosomal peptide synthetase [Micromonospora sp. WMMD1082]|uniref:non-ribosomal peptide synthetase n=1 Tax=Micromonospora sp. WMMD1082 TaxID=3016104 RepID=UPI0024167432|nr:non-ribosomal peptide synthetase [Micromonospora sp. WMMD1082]MDG4797046.1 non-ribosomal peptide synthetase [Micromonospora sp. WMMD1082]
MTASAPHPRSTTSATTETSAEVAPGTAARDAVSPHWATYAAALLVLLRHCGPHAPGRVALRVDGASATVPVPSGRTTAAQLVDAIAEASWNADEVSAPAAFHWRHPRPAPDAQLLLAGDETRISWQLTPGWSAPMLATELDRNLASLMAQMADDPHRPIGTLAVPDRTAQQWLTHHGRPADTAQVSGLVPELVSRQAHRHPERPAFGSGPGTLTYGDLDARANQLARVLRELGAQRDGCVALMMDRGSEMLVSFLAILKSGAAAILLDPAHPAQRIAEVLELARPRAVLTLARLGAVLPAAAGTVVAVDTEWPRIHRLPSDDAGITLHPEDVAYVVHTSGSTGTPKRVAVLHRSVAHSVATHQEGHRISAADRAAWLAPPGSSVSVGELWPYLCAGASVHTAPPEIVGAAPLLRDWLVREQITKAYVSMPLAEQLYQLPWPADTALRLLTVGSDKVRRWAAPELPFEVAVACGSSEANGISSCLVPWEDRLTSATATAADRAAPPPIGRPWPGVRVELLDAGMRRLLPGAVGEMYLGGPELARGYLGDPGHTADRFRPDPYGPPGARLYRTGDLAYFDEQGRLHHRGRVDREVKIRGFRVDPAEVERALLAQPGVDDAVVVALADEDGERQLCAYLVAPTAEPHLVRAAIVDVLPGHAVPAAFTLLDRLPVTANGKVDRNALPAPDWTTLRKPYRAPRDEVERQLAQLWADLLPVAQIGLDDHFFHLGGDSMSANRLAVRLNSRLRARVTVRAVLEHPTLVELSEFVRARLRVATRS